MTHMQALKSNSTVFISASLYYDWGTRL